MSRKDGFSREEPRSDMGPKNILLIHDDKMQLPFYRIQIYRYLHNFLKAHNYNLIVIADGSQEPASGPIEFPLFRMKLGLAVLIGLVHKYKPHACLLVVNHSKSYFFSFLLFLRATRIKAITWTHGVNLQRKHSRLSRLMHNAEHALCDGIILYAPHLIEFIAKSHRSKVFIANNTLNLAGYDPERTNKKTILAKYGIDTGKNIVFIGRIQKRKRIHDLFSAFEFLQDKGSGLVLIGPDDEGIAASLANKDRKIFIIGPLYGADALDLLSSCDVFCIPGAIGLSIVDAMYCGLPVVTEKVDHGPEIMYLHDGENGFMVEMGDPRALADRLGLLLEDDQLRLRFSQRAKEEIKKNGHIDNLCTGVLQSLDHSLGSTRGRDRDPEGLDNR